MANPYFSFKQFTVHHDRCGMKVTTDGCLFGAWVATQLQDKTIATPTMLDIGTGTGLLSLMVAQKTVGTINAIEIDETAAGQAGDNVQSSPWSNRIKVVHADILSYSSAPFDVIFCNPPFYENELRSPDEKKNAAHHSTELHLAAVCTSIRELLSDNGIFFLLLPYKRAEEIKPIFSKEQLYISDRVTVYTSKGRAPFRIMIRGSKLSSATKESLLAIRDEQGAYTMEFTALLKDYYLYM